MADSLIDKASIHDRRVHARRESDAEHDQLALLLAQLPDAILCFDRNWVVTFANAEAVRISHLHHSDLHTKTHWQLFPELIGTELEHTYRKVMRTRIPQQVEYFYRPFDVWLDVRVFPLDEGIAVYYRDITDRKGAEFLRDASVQQLRRVLETTNDGIVTIDRHWNFSFVNRRASELLSPKGELRGKNLWEAFPAAKQSSELVYHYNRTMDEGLPGEFEVFYPDDLNLWLSIQCSPFENGIVIFFRDITERKQNEEDLVASEARYRVLADLNPQAIWMGSPDGTVTYANQGFLDYVGQTVEDLANLGWLTCFHPDDRARVLATWSHSLATGTDYDVEARMIRARDGLPRWWWIRGQPVRDEAGRILNWLGVAADIDDRKTFAETLQQRQEETEHQRAELETVYQTAPIGLALFDPIDFRYVRLNERQAEIVGKPRDQIVGRTLTEISPIPGLQEMFEQVAAGHPIRNQLLEGELPSRPGEHRYWNVNFFPVYNADGTIQAITAATLEITNQKKAEAALIQSEKLAAVGRLASSISHEINNPLESITNLLYLIAMSDELPDTIQDYVHTAQAELARVCQIATQTLRFHRQAVRASHVSAADLVNAVLNLYQGRLANSNIHVEATYATATKILCFENDIRQVLNNLIANSIDAMRQGGRLVVRAHDATEINPSSSTGESRRGIRITIADTGQGICPAARARLFEPFYTTKDLNGTGLGLWISEGIVRRHHGRLTFRSSEHPSHHGTIFSLFLPANELISPEPT